MLRPYRRDPLGGLAVEAREGGAQGQLDLEGGADAGEELGGAERVAAEGKERVMAADALHPQNVGPEACQQVLDGIGWRLARLVVVRPGQGRGGERGAVELAIG